MTKIIFFFFLLMFFSCQKDQYDVIPDVYINVDINLNIFPVGVGDIRIFDAKDLNVNSLGYNNNGILIIRKGISDNPTEDFEAYDRTCPVCISYGNKVVDKTTTTGIVKCSHCGTQYNLYENGIAINKNLFLKKYKVFYNVNNNTLRVMN